MPEVTSQAPSLTSTEDAKPRRAKKWISKVVSKQAKPKPVVRDSASKGSVKVEDEMPLATVDYAPPPALDGGKFTYAWDEKLPLVETFDGIGKALAAAGHIYRDGVSGQGLLYIPPRPEIPMRRISDGRQLGSLIIDHVLVQITDEHGEKHTKRIASGDLTAMLKSEAFLQAFRPVDQVSSNAMYLPDYKLVTPGYNDGGFGHRVFYRGARVQRQLAAKRIKQFLDQMDFASNADRTNAIALALTRLLRNLFIDGKPFGLVTATKSHAGKDTIILFVMGASVLVSVSYERTDWAVERSIVRAVKATPEVAVINIENARMENAQRYIASAFVERVVTSSELLLDATGVREPIRRPNDLLLVMSTNEGSVSADLQNRSCHVHLNPVGNVEDRASGIGNPKLEFLPKYREEIEAELHGMIEAWIEAGKPLDTSVKHPFSRWAQVVGGILKANGFADFLVNYGERKASDDPLRHRLGLLGAAYIEAMEDRTDDKRLKVEDFAPSRDNGWQRPADWAKLAVDLGVIAQLVSSGDRQTDAGRTRGIGLVFNTHRDESFEVETDRRRYKFKLQRARRRWPLDSDAKDKKACTIYRFVVVEYEDIPADADKVGDAKSAAAD